MSCREHSFSAEARGTWKKIRADLLNYTYFKTFVSSRRMPKMTHLHAVLCTLEACSFSELRLVSENQSTEPTNAQAMPNITKRNVFRYPGPPKKNALTLNNPTIIGRTLHRNGAPALMLAAPKRNRLIVNKCSSGTVGENISGNAKI